jgi:hypothetical protein
VFVSGDRPERRACSRCGVSKPLADFSWRRRAKFQRDTFCRACRAAYGKEHYAANRQRYIDQARARKQAAARERYAFLIRFLHEHPCVDCGETDPVVLEFDHLADKEFNIGQGFAERNWESVLAEMQKCEVVCANCHRRRTARRRRSFRIRLTEG